jgi:uncharacterized membrane protein YGL010W
MKNLTQHLVQYAAYHRDSRNILTHFVGVPPIVFAVVILLSRPAYTWGGVPASPAVWLALAAAAFYIRLDLKLGAVLSLFLVVCVYGAASVAALSTTAWLGWGIGIFAVGWAVQFLGHYFEGRKPAFVDDVMGLLIGPLFVTAELAFLLRFRRPLQAQIDALAGPVQHRSGLRPTPKH